MGMSTIIIIIIISLFFEGNSHKIIIHDKIQNLSTRRPSDKHNIHVITILNINIYSNKHILSTDRLITNEVVMGYVAKW